MKIVEIDNSSIPYAPSMAYVPTSFGLDFYGKCIGKYSSPIQRIWDCVWEKNGGVLGWFEFHSAVEAVFLLGLAGLVAEVENLKGQNSLGLEGPKGGRTCETNPHVLWPQKYQPFPETKQQKHLPGSYPKRKRFSLPSSYFQANC